MTLSISITKKAVSFIMPKMWHITLNMISTDATVEVLNKDYSVRYRLGDDIAAKEAEFIALMQADIDQFKSEQTIFNAAALNTATANIQGGLVV